MWNPISGRVSVARDIKWLDTLLGDDYNTITAVKNDDDSVSAEDDVIKTDAQNSNSNDESSTDSSDSDDENKDSKDNNDSDKSDREPEHDSHDDTESLNTDDIAGNPKLQRELRKLNIWYNPTVDELGDVAFVGGTDKLYDNPTDFKEVWFHTEAWC